MAVDLTWAGGEHSFDLKIEHLRALQDRCDAGPEWVMRRLLTQNWLIDDILVPIRLGLEGGGMDKEAARRLVAAHIEGNPKALLDSRAVAHLVIKGALVSDSDDQPGEFEAGAEETSQTHSREENGDSATSTSSPESLAPISDE